MHIRNDDGNYLVHVRGRSTQEALGLHRQNGQSSGKMCCTWYHIAYVYRGKLTTGRRSSNTIDLAFVELLAAVSDPCNLGRWCLATMHSVSDPVPKLLHESHSYRNIESCPYH